MPGIRAIVTAISNDLVAALAAANATPLVDGAILIGRQHIAEASSPPRVVFIPVSSTYGPPKPSSSWSNAAASEIRLQIQQRSILTETVTFEVHVWGRDANDDQDLNYDATQALAQQVIRSAHYLTAGNYAIGNGRWTDGANGGSNLIAFGREYVFTIALQTPILDAAYVYAPSDVAPAKTTRLDPNDGSATEIACTGS